MRILLFSTLFPNAESPSHGIFVENRLRHLVAGGDVSAHVIAPVPWFPFRQKHFGKYAGFAAVRKTETRHGLTVEHPRYPLIPKVGMNLAPRLMAGSLRSKMRQVAHDHGPFDLIDAHYFYPDGVAAAHIAQDLGLPFVVTARGTDINLIPDYPGPRAQILRAAGEAGAIITVCQALKDQIEALAGDTHPLPPIRVLRNGVDLEMFRPANRDGVRKKFGFTRPTLLSVGLLTERKGHHLVIDALKELPDFDLAIAGGGEEERRLKAQAAAIGLEGRVHFLGRLPHEQLYEVYSAADILVLASSREGWPNVLLEAMACGTPVVATNVWGSGEVVQRPEAGLVVHKRTAHALAEGVRSLRERLPDRAATRLYAEGFSWDDTTRGQTEVFRDVLARRTTS